MGLFKFLLSFFFVAIQAAQDLAKGDRKHKPKQKDFVTRLLEDTPLRSVIFKKAGEQVEKKTLVIFYRNFKALFFHYLTFPLYKIGKLPCHACYSTMY